MIPFNPENKILLPMEEIFSGACTVRTKEEARQYLDDYIDYIRKNDSNSDDLIVYNNAEDIAKQNLGYWAGYHSNSIRENIEELFECEHPIFGSIKEFGIPSAQEALKCGRQRITLRELRQK